MNLRYSILCCVALESALLAAGCGRGSERDAAMAAWRAEPGHKDPVMGVSFSPDGKRIFSVSYDGRVITWDAASGRQVQLMQAQRQMVCAMALSADGKMLATGSHDKTIRVMEAETGKELRILTGHIREVCGLAFSPDGRRLVSTDQHGVARLWDTATWEVLQKWGGSRYIKPGEFSAEGDPNFSPDGRWLAIPGFRRDVWIFDVATAKFVRRLAIEGAEGDIRPSLSLVAFTPDGRQLIGVLSTNQIVAWDVRTWKQREIELTGIRSQRRGFWPYAGAISPDGRLLAFSGTENAYVVDLATGKKLHTLSGHTGFVWTLAFSPDGKWLVTGGTDCTVKLWDVATGRALRSFGTAPPPREMTDY